MTRLADDRGWIICGGFETFGRQIGVAHPLLDQLPGAIEVRAGLEQQHDRRQTGDRFGADRVDEGDAVQHQRLHRDGDELLDFSGG